MEDGICRVKEIIGINVIQLVLTRVVPKRKVTATLLKKTEYETCDSSLSCQTLTNKFVNIQSNKLTNKLTWSDSQDERQFGTIVNSDKWFMKRE